MEEKKMTKKDYYMLIKEIIENNNIEEKEELIEFINKQVIQIETKAQKAKIRAEEKKSTGDELRSIVKSVLTTELQTSEVITEKIAREDITKAKVIARLTQLVKLGEVEKADIKSENGKTIKAYKLID